MKRLPLEECDFNAVPDLSCLDWEKRIRDKSKKEVSLMPDGLVVVDSIAANARKAFGYLHLPDVPGQPTFADSSGEWFLEIVEAVFGTFNGTIRLVNEFFILVPKKQSKTTNSAGIMLVATLLSKRPRAEFLLIAPTHEVAKLAFSQAVGMVEADKELLKRFHVKDYVKQIVDRTTGATLTIKTFDPSVLTGTRPSGVLIDELHVISEMNKADRVLGQLRGGLISQPEAFLLTITTQSENPPSGIFKSELMKARKIRDGELRLKMLPILYEFPADIAVAAPNQPDKWRDPKTWWMVTPNRGRSMTLDRLREEYDKADSAGMQEMRRWASQHLNIEVGMALRSDHWVGARYWQNAGTPLTLEQLIERSEVMTIGIDGGGLQDMLGLTVCGREADTKRWMAWSHAWLHVDALERYKAQEQLYRQYATDGDLTLSERLGEDIEQLGDFVERVHASNKLDKIGVDPLGIGLAIDEMEARGIDTVTQVVGISQGFRLMGAIKTVERRLADGTLVHAEQALTAWCAGNARVEPRGNAILITKQASGTGKIDPLMALFDAVDLMSRNPAAASKHEVFFV